MLQHPVLKVAALALFVTGPGLPATAAAATSITDPAATSTPTTTPSSTASVGPTSTPTTTPTSTPNGTPTTTPSTTIGVTPTATADPATVAVLALPGMLTVPGARKALPWPKTGHAQLAVAGIGPLGRSGNRKAAPIASVTKVMTAYVVLRDHPLPAGRNGPTIVVTAAEAGTYARRKARGESLVKVAAGERISQRQALQGLLLASGNNMADILARWDAGSVRGFVRRMNTTAARLGMTSTHYADASGLAAGSRSTTDDLLKLAPAAMADRTFATIVGQKSATIPLSKIKNTNKLLGRHGVIGIKTGSTMAAGGCLLFAARHTVAGKPYTIYGAVLGASGPRILTHALATSDALVVATRKSLRSTTLLPAGRTVATLRSSAGDSVRLTLRRDFTVVGLPGLTYTVSLPPGLAPCQVPTTLIARTGARTVALPLVTT
jgi:serine-type D-Ala-D-Ala carboxypeptidase (penicillin-binding protein 5/6)